MKVGTEAIAKPISPSALNKKGLCDYVLNVATGCGFGCTFCLVPSTPMVRMKGEKIGALGIEDPFMEWGQYLLIREDLPKALEEQLQKTKHWPATDAGRGVTMLSIGTDPYQNGKVAAITRRAVELLLEYDRPVRILTRSPLWTQDISLLRDPRVTVGMSIPCLNDEWVKLQEPKAPPVQERLNALEEGANAGVRTFVAAAPTPPVMEAIDFLVLLDQLMQRVNPEVIFWEPINARGVNAKRMEAAGVPWACEVASREAWAKNFVRQWEQIAKAAARVRCSDRLYIWTDAALGGYHDQESIESWWYRPTPERWEAIA